MGKGTLKVVALHGQPLNQGRRTADNNELQAPHRLVMNLGNSGAPPKSPAPSPIRPAGKEKFKDESGLGAGDFCNTWTLVRQAKLGGSDRVTQ
jgi:hypothetical protein